MNLSIRITANEPPAPPAPDVDFLDVTVSVDGKVTIVADANTAATLAGRKGFGDLPATQRLLGWCIATAWYANGCRP